MGYFAPRANKARLDLWMGLWAHPLTIAERHRSTKPPYLARALRNDCDVDW